MTVQGGHQSLIGAPEAAEDSMAFRRALGQFATGVAVVTTLGGDGAKTGLTVNSFTSVSLDPPLVLWCLGRESPSAAVFEAATHFAVNVLAADQAAVSQRFAGPTVDRFKGIETVEGLGGVPLLTDCLAQFECAVDAVHEGGDHLIFVGRVARLRRRDGDPLVYFGGRYRTLGAD